MSGVSDLYCGRGTNPRAHSPNANVRILLYDNPTTSVDAVKWTTIGTVTTDGTNIVIGGASSGQSAITSITLAYPTGTQVCDVVAQCQLPATSASYTGFAFGNIAFRYKWEQAGTLYATVNGFFGQGADVAIGTGYTAAAHVYRMVVSASQACFYIDGALVKTINHTLTGATALKFVAYDANTYAKMDWVQVRQLA